ncbi:uncharacterized protein UV8b_01899 [Ustilaginoidea virens]|uniref:Heterokaryon incompatibility domain-containing protein n=1 Tax=Ustilaginoidea virens TaxID=1159556 RepID=A0A8E5MET5_USTVR|nr:uncharacterized protein UV8b_01899 [Ustilaginoidea virens]QUC17658.1 hypothetical protein UV8b_01899 [Ustilaginoidea virens]
MDIFLEPSDPAPGLQQQTPYLCIETWDGGLYRTYAHRKGRTSLIPQLLRQVPHLPLIEQPYLENLYPTPKEELQPFLQTWLYFGTIAEMLALNEISPGVRLIDEQAAKAEIDALRCKLIRQDENGKSIISAKEVLEWSLLFRERLALASDKTQRMTYLSDCLQYACILIHSFADNVEHTVRYSIAALGELFSTGLHAVASLAQPRILLPITGFSWYRDYIKPGGEVESIMLDNGWCLNHSSCTVNICRAFQLDLDTYQPAHAKEGCTCALIEADPEQVSGILRESDSFPVIGIEPSPRGNLDELKISVHQHGPGVSYVALSHVWANGLGNPASNSLPRCQMARIAKLVADLPRDAGTAGPPRLWLDTLCCPVELQTKMISLERIADVYRKAYHVLVLDTSLTAYKHEGSHPAELLVRAFGCSPWMRRLWTLQEGALSRALQIQFEDRAENNMVLLTRLFEIAREDARYMRLWQDVTNEFNQLLGFSPKAGPENTLTWPRPEITTVQRTLHFRTVSVPADEPLCISTLLNLDTKYIAQGQDANHRMIRMWELLAREKGGIPARLVFYLDEPIDVPGWRWAPRSLLASAVDDPVLGLDERVMRFHVDPADPNTFPLGVPTLLGLKVNLPGYRIAPTPILPGMPLHPWPDVINPTEDQVLVREETTGRWFRIMDWYRSKKLPFWTRKQRLAYDARENNPLCRAIDTGNCAILLDNELARDHSAHICCLVQVESAAPDDVAGHRPLKVRRERSAIMAALTATENKLMDFVKGLAESVARDASTDEFLQVQRAHRPGSEEWDAAEEKVRDVMKEVMREAYAHEELQKAVKDTMGEDIDDYIWVMIPKAFSHGVGLREAEGRWWIVD